MISLFIMLKVFEVGAANSISWWYLLPMVLLQVSLSIMLDRAKKEKA